MSAADDIADEMCAAISDAAFGVGVGMMLGMCGNAGQESIIENVIDDYADAAEAAFEGDFEEISSDHDEAVGMIIDVGNEIMAEAAQQCADIRAAAQTGDIFEGAIGD